ncbi:hypothetical protein [Streptomyces coeruleorubidus]
MQEDAFVRAVHAAEQHRPAALPQQQSAAVGRLEAQRRWSGAVVDVQDQRPGRCRLPVRPRHADGLGDGPPRPTAVYASVRRLRTARTNGISSTIPPDSWYGALPGPQLRHRHTHPRPAAGGNR